MKVRQITLCAAILAAISSPTPGFSQDKDIDNETIDKKELSAGIGFQDLSQTLQGRIGLGIGAFPEYEGSDNYGATALPLVDIIKPGVFFLTGSGINSNDGLFSMGLNLFHIDYSEGSHRRLQIEMGPLIRAYNGRDESDDDVLNGLGDIDRSIGIGGFLRLHAGHWQANVNVSPQDAGNDRDALLSTLDINYITSMSNGLKFSTGLSTSWADDDYMQAYFGVSDAQALQSGLRRFDSKAGFKDIGLQIKTSYALSPRWILEGQVGYWRLLNDAADSPIVKDKGSADQIRGLIGLSYQF